MNIPVDPTLPVPPLGPALPVPPVCPAGPELPVPPVTPVLPREPKTLTYVDYAIQTPLKFTIVSLILSTENNNMPMMQVKPFIVGYC